MTKGSDSMMTLTERVTKSLAGSVIHEVHSAGAKALIATSSSTAATPTVGVQRHSDRVSSRSDGYVVGVVLSVRSS